MKLKAPEGVGDPCVAGVTITPCDGVYELERDIGAVLIECFGFVEIDDEPRSNRDLETPRRGKSLVRKLSREN